MVATTPSIVSVDLALSGLMFPAGPSSGGGRTRPGFETAHRATRQHARCRRCGGRRRDLPQCRWAAAGPGRTTSRRAERSSQRGRLAGGPPPSGTHSGRLSGARNTSGATRNANARQPAGPPRVHATVHALSAVAGPPPRRPGPRSGQRPYAGCRRRQPGRGHGCPRRPGRGEYGRRGPRRVRRPRAGSGRQ